MHFLMLVVLFYSHWQCCEKNNQYAHFSFFLMMEAGFLRTLLSLQHRSCKEVSYMFTFMPSSSVPGFLLKSLKLHVSKSHPIMKNRFYTHSLQLTENAISIRLLKEICSGIKRLFLNRLLSPMLNIQVIHYIVRK